MWFEACALFCFLTVVSSVDASNQRVETASSIGTHVIAALASTPVDTLGPDDAGYGRVYNLGQKSDSNPVPMVEIDTNTYAKRLWLGPKLRLVPLDWESRHPKVAAWNSSIYVTFSLRDDDYFVGLTKSDDFGMSWSEPILIQTVGCCVAGDPVILANDSMVWLSYNADFDNPNWLTQILARDLRSFPQEISDSVVVAYSMGEPSEGLYAAGLVAYSSALLCMFLYYDPYVNWLSLSRSDDGGGTWNWMEIDAGTAAGNPISFFLTDSVLSVVHQDGLEISIVRSLDTGNTWIEDFQVSGVGYASQSPAGASDGESTIHCNWYDFNGVPSGWGGYVHYRRSTDAGETWSEIRCLSSDCWAERVAIAGNKDYVYATWNNGHPDSPNLSLNLRYSHDQGATRSPEIVVEGTEGAWESHIAVDGDQVYFVWWEQHAPDWVRNVYFMRGAWYLPGDVDLSGDNPDIADLVYLVSYMFQGGPEPIALDAAQMNGTGGVDITDLIYVVDYMFNGGPPPVGGEGI
jgi:hypothetical protein